MEMPITNNEKMLRKQKLQELERKVMGNVTTKVAIAASTDKIDGFTICFPAVTICAKFAVIF